MNHHLQPERTSNPAMKITSDGLMSVNERIIAETVQKMTLVEQVCFCAEAMGIQFDIVSNNKDCYTIRIRQLGLGNGESYWPITSERQCMELIKKFQLNVSAYNKTASVCITGVKQHESISIISLNHAVVECVAKMVLAKKAGMQDADREYFNIWSAGVRDNHVIKGEMVSINLKQGDRIKVLGSYQALCTISRVLDEESQIIYKVQWDETEDVDPMDPTGAFSKNELDRIGFEFLPKENKLLAIGDHIKVLDSYQAECTIIRVEKTIDNIIVYHVRWDSADNLYYKISKPVLDDLGYEILPKEEVKDILTSNQICEIGLRHAI